MPRPTDPTSRKGTVLRVLPSTHTAFSTVARLIGARTQAEAMAATFGWLTCDSPDALAALRAILLHRAGLDTAPPPIEHREPLGEPEPTVFTDEDIARELDILLGS